MIYPMYSIRDVKTTFFPPQVAQNEEEAKRNFSMMVNNPQGVMGFSPKDFDLYFVGTFDTEKGVMVAISPIEFVVAGSAMVVPDEK